MRNLFLVLTFVCSSLALTAQHAPHYTQFMFNQLAYNPAYAGSKEAPSFMALYRHQWEGITGAPRTINFHAHTPFFKNRCGAGLSLVGDQIGMLNTLYANLHYSYRIKINSKSNLAFGLTGRLEFGRIDWRKADPLDLGDSTIPQVEEDNIHPNFGFGIYYNHKNYYVGFSAPALLRTTVLGENYVAGEGIHAYRNYYLTGGLIMRMSRYVAFRPSALLTYNPNAPFEFDMNASFLFFDRFWAGITYRLGDSFDAVFNYQFTPQLRAGIGVDLTLTKLNQYTPGTWEIMVEYTMKYEGQRLNNIRFF